MHAQAFKTKWSTLDRKYQVDYVFVALSLKPKAIESTPISS